MSDYMLIIELCSGSTDSVFLIKREHVPEDTQKWIEKNSGKGKPAPALDTDDIVTRNGVRYRDWTEDEEELEKLEYTPIPSEHVIRLNDGTSKVFPISGNIQSYIFTMRIV